MFSSFFSASPTEFPEIETVKDAGDLKALAEKAFNNLVEADAAEWTIIPYEDQGLNGVADIKIFDRVLPNAVVSTGKATGTLFSSPKELYEKFWNFDLEWIKQFDADTSDFTRLIDGDDIILARTRSNAPFPVTAREFVTVRAKKEVDGVYYIYGISVNYAPATADANFVRGVMHTTGMIFRPVEGEPNRTEFTRVSAIDPKGSIPLWVVDLVKKKNGEFVARLRQTTAGSA